MSEQLNPAPTVFVLSDGTECVIYKTKARHIPATAELIARIITGLAEVPGATLGFEFLDRDNVGQLLQLIAKFARDLPEHVANHCSLSVEEVMDLDGDDYLLLILKIIEVNKRFFSERLGPAFLPQTASE
jgi:hypothetical protein